MNYTVIGGGGIYIDQVEEYLRITETTVQSFVQCDNISFLDGWDGTISAGNTGAGTHAIDEYEAVLSSLPVTTTITDTTIVLSIMGLTNEGSVRTYTYRATMTGLTLTTTYQETWGSDVYDIVVKYTYRRMDDTSILDATIAFFWEFS